MKKKEMREIIATYCDYCGTELTGTMHSSVITHDGIEKDFCSNRSRPHVVTCLEKWKEEERDRLIKSRASG